MTPYIFFNVKWFKLKAKEGKVPVRLECAAQGMGWGAFWRKKGHKSEWQGKGLGVLFSAVWISRGRAMEESIRNPGASEWVQC